jgi:hypothetical protein
MTSTLLAHVVDSRTPGADSRHDMRDVKRKAAK